MIRDEATLGSLLDTLERFTRERLMLAEAGVDRDGAIPDELVAAMAELGLAGLSLPESWGGLGLTVEEKMRAVIVCNRTTPAFYRRFSTNEMAGMAIAQDGSEAQRRAWLPGLASGRLTASFALTEPEAGSDAGALATRAERDGGDYVLTGRKRFITNAPQADLFLLMARTGRPEDGPRGVSAFLVEADRPGLAVAPADRKMGLHGNDTADVVLEGCRVPAANRIGAEGAGFAIAMRGLDLIRIEAAATAVGNAERLIGECLEHARERRQFGRPLADFQLVQAMLADSRAEAYAARCMVLDAARLLDDGAPATEEVACAKLFATETVGRIADRAVQIHGGSGFMQGTPVERFYRDVRVYRIYDGTSQIQQLLIARHMLRA